MLEAVLVVFLIATIGALAALLVELGGAPEGARRAETRSLGRRLWAAAQARRRSSRG